MIEINIDPNMFALGPLLITWHGFFSAVGLAAGLWLTAKLCQGTSVTADDVYTVAMAAVPGGIVGARLLFVLENLWLFADRPWAVLAINEGGISIYGAVIGGSIAGAILTRYLKLPVALLADRAAIGLIVGEGIGRLGDIINGEHHGRPAEGLPWSIVYTHPQTLGEPGVSVHPAVAYEMIWDLVMGGLLYLLLRRRPREGMTYVAYLIVYSLGRLWTGFFRKDVIVLPASPMGDIGLGMAQLIAVIMLVIAVPWFFTLLRDAQRRRLPAKA